MFLHSLPNKLYSGIITCLDEWMFSYLIFSACYTCPDEWHGDCSGVIPDIRFVILSGAASENILFQIPGNAETNGCKIVLVTQGIPEYKSVLLGFDAMASKYSLWGMQALYSERGLLT